MRKLFLLISVLTLSIAVNATTHEIGPNNPEETVNNQLISALGSAADGDVIILTAGVYNEASDYVVFNKNVEVRASAGANPVVQVVNYLKVEGGKHVIIDGLTFDGSAQGSRDQYFRFTDNGDNTLELNNCTFNAIKKNIFRCESGKKFALLDVKNCSFAGSLANVMKLESNLCGTASFDGCEFSNTADIVIRGTSTSHLDECVVNDCYFHNNTQQSIYFEASGTEGTETCDELTVTNSTFTNTTALTNWISVIDIRPNSATNTIKVTVDHCTFYNNPTVDDGHANIRTKDISDVTVSNSIFAYPEAYARRATYCTGGGNINNCLTYNYTATGTKGHAYGCTVNAASAVGDPLFNDLANNKYTYDGDWVTPSISPARGAGADGSDLGDPRWYTDETLPTTSFASAYDLVGTKALLTGNIRLNASNHIEYYNNSENGTAKWKLNIGKTCRASAVVDVETGCTSGRQLTLTVKDADGNTVATLAQASATYNDADINLGEIVFEETGDYTFILTNSTSHSSAILEKITLTYEGGAVKAISTSANTTLNVADAWFSGCTRDNEKTYIQYPSSETSSAWIKWNIATSETKYYDLTVNVNTTYAHEFGIAIYEDENEDPVASAAEPGYTSSTGDGLALELGRVNLVGGKNYVVKVTNATSGSQAKVTSVVFAPVVATATELPNTLAFSNAVLSEKANITDGMLYFNEPDADKDPRGEWAQWEVTTDHDGLFLFTMGVTSTNGQNYKITIKDDGDNELDYYETSLDSGDKTVTHYFALSAGNYFVKVENTRSFSKGHLTSLVVTEPAGVVTLDEAATSNESWVEKVVDKEAAVPLYDVQIKRTIKAGMYNTFCLPFEVTSSQCKDIFGSDVQIRTLDSATVDEDFVLTLDFKKSSDIYPGTPVLIQTSRDIVNPVFTGVKFTRATPSATTKTNADFYGTFVKTALEANENILFLGANNKLYFPTASVDIYGMRGWFVIHGVSASAIKRARIVENHNTATDIEIVGNQKKVESQKLIENGQLFIIRDGIRYNVMGARVK